MKCGNLKLTTNDIIEQLKDENKEITEDIIADLTILSNYIAKLKTRADMYHSQCNDDMELGSGYAFSICVKEIDKLLNKYKGE